ncbi:MAG: hypothetical protein EOO02_24820, partial [Chitinophagaceae bacterium]
MNQHYLPFTVDDFIADEEFQRYIMNPDPVTDQLWQDWFLKHPDKKNVADEAASFLLNIQFNTSIPDKNAIQLSLEKNLDKISALEMTEQQAKGRYRRRA